MARAQKAYSVNTNKKVITIYENIKQKKKDEEEIKMYVNCGYKIKYAKKITVEDMKKELKKHDETALKEFERLYNLNEEGGALGFHRACKYYTDWKKEQEKKKKESKKTTEE